MYITAFKRFSNIYQQDFRLVLNSEGTLQSPGELLKSLEVALQTDYFKMCRSENSQGFKKPKTKNFTRWSHCAAKLNLWYSQSWRASEPPGGLVKHRLLGPSFRVWVCGLVWSEVDHLLVLRAHFENCWSAGWDFTSIWWVWIDTSDLVQ